MMNRLRLISSVLRFCFYLGAASQPGLVAAEAGFHHEICYATFTTILQSGNSSIALDPSLVVSVTDVTNPILTYRGCQQICGSGTGWYTDTGPRLLAWLLPIFLLVSNMQYASIGMERFLLILHLLGDPIDSTWALLAKVDSWGRCLSHAQELLRDEIEVKSLTTIMAAIEEYISALDHALQPIFSTNRRLIRETGSILSENRRNEVLRTFFAVAMYAFQVLAAFVPAVGAASSPSGGRIGTAMLLSWLLPVVLLSNVVGDFGSPRNCQRSISHFMERLGQQSFQELCTTRSSKLDLSIIGIQREENTPYDASRAWSGAVYCYRPNKRFFSASGLKLALISVLPVTIAFGTAFAVLDTGPTYFTCRHILVIVVFGSWLFSAMITSLLSWAGFATGKYLWHIILIKDAVIGIPIVGLIIASSCGLWNTCYCWGGVLVHGEEGARIELNPSNAFDTNAKVIYPATVAACLFLQVCVFGLMLWIGWPGFRALWWCESEKLAVTGSKRDRRTYDLAVQEVSSIHEPLNATASKELTAVTITAIDSTAISRPVIEGSGAFTEATKTTTSSANSTVL